MKTLIGRPRKVIRAKDIMKTQIVFATVDMQISEVADLLQMKHVTGVPVVNGKGRVVGVISASDIVAFEANKELKGDIEGHGFYQTSWKEGDSEQESIDFEKNSYPEKTAEEVMTPGYISVPEDALLENVARKMLKEEVHRVLVMDEKERLKGIISTTDMVRLIAKRQI